MVVHVTSKQFVIGTVFAAAGLVAAVPARTAGRPTVDKASVLITVRKIDCAYPSGIRDENRYSWIPMMNFRVNGPIAEGAFFTVAYFLPGQEPGQGGQGPWISFDLATQPMDSNGWYTYDQAGRVIADTKGTMETGPIRFTISLRTASDSTPSDRSSPGGTTPTVIYSGTFTVKKYNFSGYPEDKNKFDYYIDQDWRLPIALVSGDWWRYQPGGATANPTPHILVTVWLQGKKILDPKANLYYQGKPILSVDGKPREAVATAERSNHNWTSYQFELHAFWFNQTVNPEMYPEFDLSQNPGDYRIRIVIDNEPVRTIDFIIGPDGKPVDNGFARQANLRYSWIFPAAISGLVEVGINRNAYRNEAFYGNPLSGFVVP